MSTTNDRPRDVRQALVAEAVALTAAGGPDRVSLREVQRRVGVSPAAAYKHYRDRGALLVAVGQRASALLADAIDEAMSSETGAEARFRAGCRAYVQFALANPGLFRSILLTHESIGEVARPPAAGAGTAGRGSYELLLDALAPIPSATAEDAPIVWAACHGLAVLLLDGPLRHLHADAQEAIIERELDLLAAGLAADRAQRSLKPTQGM